MFRLVVICVICVVGYQMLEERVEEGVLFIIVSLHKILLMVWTIFSGERGRCK